MTESAVKLIVVDAFKEYEKETGLPRHEENLGNFAIVMALVNKTKGAIWAVGSILGFVFGVPALVWASIQIFNAIRK